MIIPETEFKIKKRKLGHVLPREDDLHGSAQALIRLQDTYELDVRDFAEGEIGRGKNSWTTTARLSAQVCNEIIYFKAYKIMTVHNFYLV